MQDHIYDELKEIFKANGHRLYLVGGTVRDLLLRIPFSDYDLVTDATPEEEKAFLPDANYTFAKYGSIRLKVDGIEVDITTLRKEGEYIDHRHPSSITFVKDTKEDYLRRDFTINAMYLDEGYNLIDYCGGEEDLKKGIIRFVGDPYKRVEEDPLRILRAYRFQKRFNFKIEENTLKAIEKGKELLDELNPQKIKEEERKEKKI